jgi:hypothetical protein
VAKASEQIDKLIADHADWRGERLAELRKLINEAAPDLKEDWKWGTPAWTMGKRNVVLLGAFKEHVKIAFPKGASVDDPQGLFNASLDAKEARAIDLRQDDQINREALRALVRVAAEAGASRR